MMYKCADGVTPINGHPNFPKENANFQTHGLYFQWFRFGFSGNRSFFDDSLLKSFLVAVTSLYLGIIQAI